MSSYFNEQLEYIKYLDKHNLEYEDKSFPIFGLSFVTYISQGISPVVILVCCIYILAQVFTLDYSKEIDISKLFPLGKMKTFLTKIIVAVIASIIIFISILLCTFLIATLLNSNTGLEYPMMIQDNNSKAWLAINLTVILKDWLIVGILYYICTCFFVYILSSFIKEDGPLFLTILCILLGFTYLPIAVDFLRDISHFLPTTYMNFVDAVSGKMAIRYSNLSITLSNGLQTLTIFIILQFVICIIKEQLKKG